MSSRCAQRTTLVSITYTVVTNMMTYDKSLERTNIDVEFETLLGIHDRNRIHRWRQAMINLTDNWRTFQLFCASGLMVARYSSG